MISHRKRDGSKACEREVVSCQRTRPPGLIAKTSRATRQPYWMKCGRNEHPLEAKLDVEIRRRPATVTQRRRLPIWQPICFPQTRNYFWLCKSTSGLTMTTFRTQFSQYSDFTTFRTFLGTFASTSSFTILLPVRQSTTTTTTTTTVNTRNKMPTMTFDQHQRLWPVRSIFVQLCSWVQNGG